MVLRAPAERDWPEILELADLAVEHVSDAPHQTEWLEGRRAFEGVQRHFVAERGGTVVGYGAVERGLRDPDATYRLFVVTDWTESSEVAALLYDRVVEELAKLGARQAWLREYASDEPLIAFARGRGFEIREEYDHDGRTLVTLTKDLSGSALAVQRTGINRRRIAPPASAEPKKFSARTVQRSFELRYSTSAFNALLYGAHIKEQFGD